MASEIIRETQGNLEPECYPEGQRLPYDVACRLLWATVRRFTLGRRRE